MNLPELFKIRTQALLKDEYDPFVSALSEESLTSIRINPQKLLIQPESLDPVPWSLSGYFLPQRPLFTMDPLFHSGSYYVQEASSMFLEQAIKQYVQDENPLVLDLCAAPGGKSTHIATLLNGKGLLVANEVIRSRSNILAENLLKWGAPNTIVTNNDPRDFSRLNGLFDAVIVDAPCSGEGMFRKDPKSSEEWSVDNVALCCERQKRILADIFPALKTGGILIYSTCTYNEEENEENVKWIENELGAEFLPIKTDDSWNITSFGKGYRFFPHKTKGEGFFLAAFRKTEEENQYRLKKTEKTKNIRVPDIKSWVQDNDYEYVVTSQTVSVVPAYFSDTVQLLKKELHIVRSGIELAQIKGKDLLPDISLAFSWIINKSNFQTKELTWEEAIAYLRKEVLYFPEAPKGWILVQFQGLSLGWVKNLGNRVNNSYPQEWRIRMEADKQRYTPINQLFN